LFLEKTAQVKSVAVVILTTPYVQASSRGKKGLSSLNNS
jgi:hypothetical protein